MNALKGLLNFVLHIDKNLLMIIHQYGPVAYLFVFFIIFMETGFVVTPFLPGDSLLFASGSIAALGGFNIIVLLFVAVGAAFVGDTINYWVGRLIGVGLFERNHPLFKKKYLEKAQKFYEKHGGFAIVLGRFVPIVRTFVPFAAGVSKMRYSTFIVYNFIGGLLWVLLFTLAGFFFGNVPFVKAHFEYAMVVIVLISVVPIAVEFVRERMAKHPALE